VIYSIDSVLAIRRKQRRERVDARALEPAMDA
jgi:hypothetical protein